MDNERDVGNLIPGPALPAARKILSKVEDLISARDTTYVVTSDLTYDPPQKAEQAIVTIGKNVTLVFEGGSISGSSHFILKGNDTALQAAITRIFGDNVTVEGTWLIPFAVPQWFDAEAGKDAWEARTPHDCSAAINKAINMKQIGEVFLSHGNYFISHPIKLFPGVQLTGEYEARKSHNDYEIDLDKWGLATSIIPYFENGVDGFSGHAIIEINVNPDETGTDGTWDFPYITPGGKLQKLIINNFKKVSGSNLTAQLRDVFKIAEKVCCLAGGGFTFEMVYFSNFRRAIKWDSLNYQDNKSIERCQFMLSDQLRSRKYSDVAYFIETEAHGDAVIIRGCMTDFGEYRDEQGNLVGESHKSLHLSSSFGATIADNIFNADVVFESCIGCDYSCNHMELGAQIRIVNCDMAIRNNYIEKGYRPSIVVDVSNDDHGNPYEHASTTSQLQMVGNVFNMFVPTDKESVRTPIKEVCHFDIALCSALTAPYSISLEQNYRVARNMLRSNQPTGVMLATFAKSPEQDPAAFAAFNKRSFFLSTKSQILRNKQIICERFFEEIPVVTATIMSNEQVPNALIAESNGASEVNGSDNWPYQYWGQVIIDEARGIIGQQFEFYYSDYDSNLGNLITLHFNSPTLSFMLRITRKLKGTSRYEYVDIPVIGVKYLYDNYFSVNGYHWKNLGSSPTAVAKRTIDAVGFLNDNVRAFGTVPYGSNVSGWLKNDTVINTGTDATALWYCTGAQWLAR